MTKQEQRHIADAIREAAQSAASDQSKLEGVFLAQQKVSTTLQLLHPQFSPMDFRRECGLLLTEIGVVCTEPARW